MQLKLPNVIRSLIKATSFWQDNQLILREFRHFRWLVIAALTFSCIAAVFEGLSVGLIASFLQSLTNPTDPHCKVVGPGSTPWYWLPMPLLRLAYIGCRGCCCWRCGCEQSFSTLGQSTAKKQLSSWLTPYATASLNSF